jgi:hypothetical protein
MPDKSIVKKKRLMGEVATTKVISGNHSTKNPIKIKTPTDIVVVKKKKKKKPKPVEPEILDDDLDEDMEDDEDQSKPNISIRTKSPFDLDDPDGIVNRTKAILSQIDAERRANPLTGETDIMYDFYRAALAETLELIPKAKQAYSRYQSQSNANAFSAMITKCQELLADIQALDDRGGALDKVLDQTIIPSFLGIISNLANSYTMSIAHARAIRGLTGDQLSAVEKILVDIAKQTASYVQETQNSLEHSLRGQMNEEN